MKRIAIILTVVFLLFSICCCVASPSLKEGDIVFQISKSNQSSAIIAATKSPWSHCGIIIEKNDKLYVLEASNVVKLTPFSEWKKRGFLNIVAKKRVLDKPIKIKYKHLLNIPYDKSFRLNNNRYYCSELVWEIYKNQFNIILAKPHPVSDYKINNRKALKLMKQRNITPDQLVIAPSDIR